MSGEPWITNERRAEIEMEIGVDPIESLQHGRRESVRRLAPLEALFGPGGNWEERRKSFRYKLATEIAESIELEIAEAVAAAKAIADKDERKAALAAIRKAPSESELERLAAGHPSYVRYIKAAARMKRTFPEIKNEAQEWTEKINRDQAIVRYVTQTPAAQGGA